MNVINCTSVRHHHQACTLGVCEPMLLALVQVRQRLQRLPSGPDEDQRIQALQDRVQQLRAKAAVFEDQIVPRPVPGQYSTLVAEVQRFTGGMGVLERVLGLLHRLEVSCTAAQLEA